MTPGASHFHFVKKSTHSLHSSAGLPRADIAYVTSHEVSPDGLKGMKVNKTVARRPN